MFFLRTGSPTPALVTLYSNRSRTISNPQRIPPTSALLAESSRTRVLSLLSLRKHSDPLGDFSFFLPQMENKMDAFLAILRLKRPLAESLWVFSNPVKVPSVDLSSLPELKEFSSPSCAYLHTFSTPFWRSLFCYRTFSSSGSSLCTHALAQCPPGRASQNPQ
jgi:hypothetical protein